MFVIITVGEPIDVQQMKDPSQEIIDKYHKIYIQQLIALFETHKKRYGIEEQNKLNIL